MFIFKSNKKTLVIGCGLKRVQGAIHLDINPDVCPNVVHDLNKYPWPFEDNKFKNIIAEHIIEHIWKQGDAKGWFKLWKEVWRVCKNGAKVMIESPYAVHPLAYSDPSHISFLTETMFLFLSKKVYARARKTKNMMTQFDIDFDFDIEESILVKDTEADLVPVVFRVKLKAVK